MRNLILLALVAALLYVATAQSCTGCVQYGEQDCSSGVCVKRCERTGPVTCSNTLAYDGEGDEDEDLVTVLQYSASDYITDLKVVAGDQGVKCPDGFNKIWTDLNKDAGGDYVYLCTQKSAGKTPVVDLVVVKGGSRLYENSCPNGYYFIDTDLNQDAGGKYMYFCYLKSDNGNPIVDINFAVGKGANCQSGYTKDNNDLNESAGGDYIYTCIKKDPNAVAEIIVENVKYDLKKLTESDATVKTADSIQVENPTSSSAQGPTLSGSFTVTTTKQWSTTFSLAVGAKMTFKAGVPLVGESNVEVSTTATVSTTNGGSVADTVQRGYTLTCVADPMTVATCSAVYRQSNVDVPYCADATIKYKNGSQTKQQFCGNYKGVSVSSIMMKKSSRKL